MSSVNFPGNPHAESCGTRNGCRNNQRRNSFKFGSSVQALLMIDRSCSNYPVGTAFCVKSSSQNRLITAAHNVIEDGHPLISSFDITRRADRMRDETNTIDESLTVSVVG
jgi:hypothetical protein